MQSGRLASGGMGNFLNPPGHPEHSWHIETDLRRRPWNRGGMALSYAVECDYLDPCARAAARACLARWQRPALESPEVQQWILRVMAYFRDCYGNPMIAEPERWHVANAIVDPEADPLMFAADHFGVHFIRRYYPEYEPAAHHFTREEANVELDDLRRPNRP